MNTKKLYHLSPRPDLKVLKPSMPAEDVINCRLVPTLEEACMEETTLPESSRCVCFAEDTDENFHCNPIIKGYIYEPVTNEVPRAIFAEAPEDPESPNWCDFSLTKEHRFYKPVPVKMVGEFEMKATKSGLVPEVKWYREGKGYGGGE